MTELHMNIGVKLVRESYGARMRSMCVCDEEKEVEGWLEFFSREKWESR